MRALAALSLAAVLLTSGGWPAHAAASHPQTQITVSHAWIRVLPGTLPAGGYAIVRNTGSTPRVLIGASSPDYRHVMLHESTLHDGMSQMHRVKRLKLPPHATVKLTPGGYHLMLMHATHPVKVGDRIPVMLKFANGRNLTVDFKARPANAH